MRVVVTGATGNLGSATLGELVAAGHDVVGLSRRSPESPARQPEGVTWVEEDVSTDDLAPTFSSADAVVHLAWRFQPTRRPEVTWAANAVGTGRVLAAAGAAGVPSVVCVSSVAAYSPVCHDVPVEEDWHTDGASAAAYCREKAYVERLLDRFELRYPATRLVRVRPAFVFQRPAASEQRRIFGGPLAVPPLFKRGRLPVVPVPHGLRFQAVHAADVGRALAAAVDGDATGPFNLAGPGLGDRTALGRLLGARTVEVPARAVRAGLNAAFHGHLAPVPAELFDALARLPLMDTRRARSLLGWEPRHSSEDAVAAFLEGAFERAGSNSLPPLHR